MTVTFPPIGLGTGGASPLTDVDLIADAIEMGYRHVDTAQSYENEREVGRALDAADVPKSSVLVATKVHRDHLSYEDVLETSRQSRERLDTDTIDLLYAHFPTRTYEPTETLPAMDELVEDGVAEHLALSNFSPGELETATEILEHPIVANQIEMHPFYRQDDLREYCREAGIPIVAYTPLARGEVFDDPDITAIAEKHDTDAAAVTLAWLAGIDGVSAIPMTTSREHVRANLEAANLSLDEEDVARIESIDREKKFVEIA